VLATTRARIESGDLAAAIAASLAHQTEEIHAIVPESPDRISTPRVTVKPFSLNKGPESEHGLLFTPTSTEDINSFKYNCPLCMTWFKLLYSTRCCKNYCCSGCLIEYSRGKFGFPSDLEYVPSAFDPELTCPHCATVGLEVGLVNPKDPIRSYEDDASLSLPPCVSGCATPLKASDYDNYETLARKMLLFDAVATQNNNRETEPAGTTGNAGTAGAAVVATDEGHSDSPAQAPSTPPTRRSNTPSPLPSPRRELECESTPEGEATPEAVAVPVAAEVELMPSRPAQSGAARTASPPADTPAPALTPAHDRIRGESEGPASSDQISSILVPGTMQRMDLSNAAGGSPVEPLLA